MACVRIAVVKTSLRGADSTSFHPFTDPITLELAIEYAKEVSEYPNLNASVTYQLIALQTNQVVWQQQAHPVHIHVEDIIAGSLFSTGLPAAYDLGLQWGVHGPIFGFRASIELASYRPELGNVAIDDGLDVSEMHWFRLLIDRSPFDS